MLGLSGLGQSALGALPPNGAVPASTLRGGFILLGRQEPPWHPRPFFVAGVQGPNVRTPSVDWFFGRQEWPWHPRPYLWAGSQQIGNVGVAPISEQKLINRQEWPWHPRPLLLSAPPPVPAFRGQGYFIKRQEQPWHPSPLFFAGTFPIDYEDIQILIIF